MTRLPILGFASAVTIWLVFTGSPRLPIDRHSQSIQIVTAATTLLLFLCLAVVMALLIKKRRNRAEGLAAILVLASMALLVISLVWMNLETVSISDDGTVISRAMDANRLGIHLTPLSALIAWLTTLRTNRQLAGKSA